MYSAGTPLPKEVSKNYPGRASGSPCVDLFLTLLGMGKKVRFLLFFQLFFALFKENHCRVGLSIWKNAKRFLLVLEKS